MNIFITGVTRGIGLALAGEALRKGYRVCGVARDPEASSELMVLKKNHPSLKLVKLDLQDPEAAQKLIAATEEYESLDIVINNAGVFAEGGSREAFLKSFEVNTIIPFLVSQAFLPKLKKSSRPRLIHITSAMGSIAENASGGAYAYRASKAALNMVNKCLTVENDWLTTAVIHPGWVQTDMGGSSAPVTTLESSKGIWNVIEGLSTKDSGCFKNYQGRNLPW